MNENLIAELRMAGKVRRNGNPYALDAELLFRAADALEAAPVMVAESIAKAIEPRRPVAPFVRAKTRAQALSWAASAARSMFAPAAPKGNENDRD